MEHFIIWILVVIGPDNFPRPIAEFTNFDTCYKEQQKHFMMGLSEFKYECHERHRAIFRPTDYKKYGFISSQSR